MCGNILRSRRRQLSRNWKVHIRAKLCALLYRERCSNRRHAVGLIYRPFMSLWLFTAVIYVGDELEYMPLLIRNKAAEFLFGNIRAERVYQCYRGKDHDQSPHPGGVQKENHYTPKATNLRKMTAEAFVGSCLLDADKTL
ncbi:hypothetical protein WN943_008343 [Citrus x changshan-huyou]